MSKMRLVPSMAIVSEYQSSGFPTADIFELAGLHSDASAFEQLSRNTRGSARCGRQVRVCGNGIPVITKERVAEETSPQDKRKSVVGVTDVNEGDAGLRGMLMLIHESIHSGVNIHSTFLLEYLDQYREYSIQYCWLQLWGVSMGRILSPTYLPSLFGLEAKISTTRSNIGRFEVVTYTLIIKTATLHAAARAFKCL